MSIKIKDVKNKIVDGLELPKDIVLDLPKVTILGDREITVENHRGIIEYSTKIIRINTGGNVLKIQGENLNLKSILTEELLIEGRIISIHF